MIYLSMDLDWAPDWAVQEAADLVLEQGLALTLFVTNATPALARLAAHERVELGLHPNYMPGSSHGDTPAAVMDHLSALVPSARGVRAHGLWRGTSFVVDYGARGLAYEASDLLFLHPGITGGRYWNGVAQLPIWWEDDVHMLHGQRMHVSTLPLDAAPPLAVLNFHPILIALNSADLSGYQALKDEMSAAGRSLSQATREEVGRYENTTRSGTRDVLKAVCGWCAARGEGGGDGTLSDAAAALSPLSAFERP